MMRTVFFVGVWAVGLLACDEPPTPQDGPSPQARQLLEVPPEELGAVPRIGSVYKEAYDRAKAEINASNAESELNIIEQQVEEERLRL